MTNTYFHFKQFTIHQDRSAMKVTTDACLFGSLIPTFPDGENATRVLDIGTGTGLLSLMFAQKNKNAIIDAIEIDNDSFEQASENIAASPWAGRINIIHGDARSFSFPGAYDTIISNPPFYENELKSDNKKKNVAHHSDDLSLHELLQVIKKNLSPGGTFHLLLPYKRNEEIKRTFLQHELCIEEMILVRQSVNHDPFRIVISGRSKNDASPEPKTSEISIKDASDNYTQGFVQLLKEYYSTL